MLRHLGENLTRAIFETKEETFALALCGGRSMAAAMPIMAKAFDTHHQLLDRVHFFWVDERCVGPTDPQSNYRLANELLLQPMGVESRFIHRILGESPPDAACRRADAELRFATHTEDPAEVPALDLAILGVGDDGHVASLFGDAQAAGRLAFMHVVAPQPPENRITMTMETLVAAKRAWILALGDDKQAMLQQALRPGAKTPLAQLLERRDHRDTVIFSGDGQS